MPSRIWIPGPFCQLPGRFHCNLHVHGSGVQNYLGTFIDTGSLRNGQLNVVYAPDTGEGSVWNLSGTILNSGTWTVQSGKVKIAGVPTLHARAVMWMRMTGRRLFCHGNSAGGKRRSVYSGSPCGSGFFHQCGGRRHIYHSFRRQPQRGCRAGRFRFHAARRGGWRRSNRIGKISGKGSLIKSGDGVLLLKNRNNGFSGIARVEGGVVQAFPPERSERLSGC